MAELLKVPKSYSQFLHLKESTNRFFYSTQISMFVFNFTKFWMFSRSGSDLRSSLTTSSHYTNWWDSYLTLGVRNITQTHMTKHVSGRKDSSTPLGIYWEPQRILRKSLPLKFTFHLSIKLVCVFLNVCSEYRNSSLLTHSHAPHGIFTAYMFHCGDLIAFLSFVL